MATSSHQAVLRAGAVSTFAGSWIRIVITSFGLVLLVMSKPQLAWASDGAPVAQEGSAEQSVLVATRDTSSTESGAPSDSTRTPDADALEPIPLTSDRTPELAVTSSEQETKQTEPGSEPDTAQSDFPSSSSSLSASSPFEPVKFQGILVGKSTKRQVVANWGEPDDSVITPEGEVLGYRIHPFEAVEVLVGEGGVISAIKIALTTSLEPDHLATQLSLDQFRPATVLNDEDQPLGQAFPERGVLFMFDASDSDAISGDGKAKLTVSHVVVQPIAAAAFATRAENGFDGSYADKIRDLKTAISLDPDSAHAHYLLAQIYLATGQADLAEAAACAACELEPMSTAHQLCRAQTQELLGEYDKAVLTTRGVLDSRELTPIDKAQALFQMARLASLGDAEIASKAISFYTRTIEVADTLATSAKGKERRSAKRLLVDAHMAMAEEIARQAFNEKIQSLSLWVGRASGIAEDFITQDGGSVELRLVIAQRALGALASFRPTLDPAPWVAEAEEAAEELLEQSDDELWQARVKWELGIAYFNALRVEHVRRETAAALKYGQQAVDNLAEGAASRQAVHSSEQLAGQLYFQMGAVYAVHQLDHKKAAQWYEKADALLTGPRPVSDLYAPRREGEMLVSMGVTYWQLGEQARALQLTQSGVNLVEMAVEDGILAKTALAVPYGNLATMYKQIGETTNAAKYAELARSVAVPVAEAPPRLGRTPAAGQEAGVRQNIARQPQMGATIR
jgi:tetratricopeptide (TPR) repeat protein